MIPDLIKKRDGRIVPFEEDNIRTNIKRALEASNTDYPAALLYDLLEVRYLFNYKSKTISVEELSDFVEEIFMREGLYDALVRISPIGFNVNFLGRKRMSLVRL